MKVAIDVGDNDSKIIVVKFAVYKLMKIVGFAEIHELDVDGVIEMAEHVDVVESELHGLMMAEFERCLWYA